MNNAMLPQRTHVTFTLKWTELLDIFSNQVSLNRYMLGDCGYSGLPWLLTLVQLGIIIIEQI